MERRSTQKYLLNNANLCHYNQIHLHTQDYPYAGLLTRPDNNIVNAK